VARLDNPYYTGDIEVSTMATMKQRLGKEAAKARRKAA